MKKLLTLLVAFAMILSTFALTSCGKEEEVANNDYTRMTVDINPSIEMMVDSENKVVSVTALNDDGSILIAGEAIVGKTAEEATELIITLAGETGYLVSGNVTADENTVKVSVSGNTEFANELLADVKAKVSTTLESLDIEGKVEQVKALALDELRALAMDTALFTEEEVAAMTEQQLLNAIAAGRIETALLLTEDMREAYLAAKEYEISFAESEATAAIIEDMGTIYGLIASGYKTAVDTYSSAITALDNFRYDHLVSPNSEYQKSLQRLREAKAEYLKQRTYVASLEVNGEEYASASLTLQASEENYDRLLAAYEALGNTVNENLESLIATLRSSEQVLRSIEDSFSTNIKDDLKAKASELEGAVNRVKDGFFAEFEAAHADDIAAIEAALIAQKNSMKQQAAQ